jgi:hypothetical protein
MVSVQFKEPFLLSPHACLEKSTWINNESEIIYGKKAKLDQKIKMK